MKKPILTLYLALSVLLAYGQTIAPSNSRISTHTLSSGNVTIGISAAGGGYMNMVDLPGKGDIMDVVTDMYGRGGQSAMRDQLRSGRYNPTQAGFNENLGTPSEILVYPDSMIVTARPCALWHGDGQYDYIRWENIGADPYQDDNGNSDVDGIDEEGLEGKQLTEVTSEFDFYGIYENYLGRNGVSIPCFRHYYEYRFIRPPGHCLSQFGPGTPPYNPGFLHDDISTAEPTGTHAATASDISNLIKVWSLRNDLAKWDPSYRHLLSSEGVWILQQRTEDLPGGTVSGSNAPYQPLIIIADSADRDKGLALGLYRPESNINKYVIAGINETTGKTEYEDDRRKSVQILEQPKRIGTMAKYGFLMTAKGMLNRNRLDSAVYEMLRSEFYILVGTPNEIFEAANKIHELNYWSYEVVSEWDFISDLEGWELTKSLSGSVDNSILKLDITGADPFMMSADNLNIEVSTAKYVIFKMKNGTNTGSGRFYWTTNTQTTFNFDYSKEISIQSQDPEFSTYVLDMTGESNWNGVIKRVRLDPSNSATSGKVDIDYIKIVEGLPSATKDLQVLSSAKIYPNPARDLVIIETGKHSSIILLDVSGRVIKTIDQGTETAAISTGDWSPGMYFARISNAGGIQILKFIVE